MSYYMGDFYRGDFYRGDPGIGSFFAGLAKKAVGFIPGVGPAISTAIDIAGKAGRTSEIVKRTMGAAGRATAGVGRVVTKHPVLTAAAGAGAAGAVAGAMGGRRMGAGRAAPEGVPGMRRHRRMRVTNPKALRRAIRRTTGFAKLAMRTIHLVHPKKKVRFGGFRRRRTRT